jgi:hypothetical protein
MLSTPGVPFERLPVYSLHKPVPTENGEDLTLSEVLDSRAEDSSVEFGRGSIGRDCSANWMTQPQATCNNPIFRQVVSDVSIRFDFQSHPATDPVFAL